MLSKSEIRLKVILDSVLPKERFVDNFRPDWLKNPNTGQNLELDRFYPDLKIGIEFNGPQHRRKNDSDQWSRDKIKKHLCAKQKVALLIFYWNELRTSIAKRKIEEVFEMRECWKNGKIWKKQQH